MGKASSKKKVARAAKAGSGGRARSAGERNIVFPATLTVVVLLGVALVVYARADRSAEVLVAPVANVDHWHSSYGIDICGTFEPDLAEFASPVNAGTHTHGDGLIHIHPFAESRSGKNATLVNYLKDAGMEISDDELVLADGRTFKEGENSCGDEDAIVQVAYWSDAAAASAGNASPTVFTEDFGKIRFLADGEAFTVSFAPEGADIPLPESTSGLSSVSDLDLGPGSEDFSPTDTTDGETTDGETTDGETTDTTDGETTDTTDGETTDTTEADRTDTTEADTPDTTEADGEPSDTDTDSSSTTAEP